MSKFSKFSSFETDLTRGQISSVVGGSDDMSMSSGDSLADDGQLFYLQSGDEWIPYYFSSGDYCTSGGVWVADGGFAQVPTSDREAPRGPNPNMIGD